MAFDEAVANRLRSACAGTPDLAEKRMFGGIAFMVAGHMACGVVDDTLMVRVGPDRHAQALKRPHAREMDFTGRSMKGFVYVDAAGFATDQALADWVELSLEFVRTLPPR